MKKFMAEYASKALTVVAVAFVFILKGAIGEVKAPAELLKK